jgi:hypothetical protein
MLSIIFLSLVIQSVIILCVIILSIAILCVIMLSFEMLSVTMLSFNMLSVTRVSVILLSFIIQCVLGQLRGDNEMKIFWCKIFIFTEISDCRCKHELSSSQLQYWIFNNNHSVSILSNFFVLSLLLQANKLECLTIGIFWFIQVKILMVKLTCKYWPGKNWLAR